MARFFSLVIFLFVYFGALIGYIFCLKIIGKIIFSQLGSVVEFFFVMILVGIPPLPSFYTKLFVIRGLVGFSYECFILSIFLLFVNIVSFFNIF